jgi:prepilin-type N-terminal cleavage/methylation domain-containing protein
MNRRGFSLIELLISLAITSVVVAGISFVLLKQSQASVKQTQKRTLEETGREALLEIASAVRLAGSGIAPTAAFDFDRYSCTSPGSALSCNNDKGRDRTDGPDELVVSHRDPLFSRVVRGFTGTGPWSFTISRALTAPLNQGRIVLLLCSGADPVAYTAVDSDAAVGATAIQLRAVQPKDGYYPTPGALDGCFGTGAMVLVERDRYFVANDPFDGVPALWRDRGRSSDPQIFLRGIEDLQLTYTIGPPPPGSAAAGTAGPAGCNDPRATPGAQTGWVYGLCNQGTPLEDAAKAPPDWINADYTDGSRFTGHAANIRSVQINIVARSTALSPDQTGDDVPQLANRVPRPADQYARSVLSITEQTPNLLSRARLMPSAGGG